MSPSPSDDAPRCVPGRNWGMDSYVYVGTTALFAGVEADAESGFGWALGTTLQPLLGDRQGMSEEAAEAALPRHKSSTRLRGDGG